MDKQNNGENISVDTLQRAEALFREAKSDKEKSNVVRGYYKAITNKSDFPLDKYGDSFIVNWVEALNWEEFNKDNPLISWISTSEGTNFINKHDLKSFILVYNTYVNGYFENKWPDETSVIYNNNLFDLKDNYVNYYMKLDHQLLGVKNRYQILYQNYNPAETPLGSVKFFDLKLRPINQIREFTNQRGALSRENAEIMKDLKDYSQSANQEELYTLATQLLHDDQIGPAILASLGN